MSRGGGDYRDAFREGTGTYFEQELYGERAFVAGHSVSLREFIDAFMPDDGDDNGGLDSRGSGGNSEEGVKGSSSSGGGGGLGATGGITAYLAQHDLLAQVPELSDACSPTPPYVGLEDNGGGGGGEDKYAYGDGDKNASVSAAAAAMRRVWLGPAGTVTPLHRDPYHNVLCQVWGVKLVRMYRAADAPLLYPFPSGFLRNTSQVDVDDVDKDKFPLFSAVPHWELSLGPGDMLFMPAKTW